MFWIPNLNWTKNTTSHKLYDTISLQYECPIILKAGLVSSRFDVQMSHRNIVECFERSLLCKEAGAKSSRWDLVQLYRYLDANLGVFITPTTHHVALVKAYYQSLPIRQPSSHITHLKYILPPCLLEVSLIVEEKSETYFPFEVNKFQSVTALPV